MKGPSSIFLIGLPGVGKTTLGRAASRQCGIPFIDLDERVEEIANMSVREIFERHGEEYFRGLERRALQDIPHPAIIATGGGTPCYGDNMRLMTEMGKVVHLTADTQRIVDRILDAANTRPMFKDLDAEAVRQKLLSLWGTRQPFYTLAPYSFDTTLLDTEAELARTVQSFINLYINL